MEHTENAAVGCVIMASGRAVRFGSNKLLADFGSAPLIARALDVTETPALAARVVVTRSPEVAAIAREAGVKPSFTACRAGTTRCASASKRCFRSCPALRGASSCPGISRSCGKKASRRWCAISRRWTKKNGPSFGWGFRAEDGTERLGSPVLFGSSYFGALCSLPEGKGGGVVIRRHPESVRAVYAARQEELEDADTAEELERLRKLL